MRKPRLVLFALALGVALLLTAALPVAAAAPGDQGPVNRVSWEGNMTPKLLEAMGIGGHFDGSVMVMKRADTISGFIKTRNFVTHQESFCISFISASFSGGTAIVHGWFYNPEWGGTLEEPVEETWTMIDGGEPGAGNDMMQIKYRDNTSGLWVDWMGIPVPIPLASHGNIQVHTAE